MASTWTPTNLNKTVTGTNCTVSAITNYSHNGVWATSANGIVGYTAYTSGSYGPTCLRFKVTPSTGTVIKSLSFTLTTSNKVGGYTTADIDYYAKTSTSSTAWPTVSDTSSFPLNITAAGDKACSITGLNTGSVFYVYIWGRRKNTSLNTERDIYVSNIKSVSAALQTYTISYNANGHGTAPSSQTKTHGTALTLRAFISAVGGTDTTVTITGNANGNTWSGSNGNAHYNTTKYTQNKWNTASDGSGTGYNSEASYTTNAAATMYAQWTTTAAAGTSYTLPSGTPSKASSSANSYVVTFNANGGSTTKTSQTSTKTTSYSFKGWFTASSGGTQRTTSSRVTAAETVYAQMNSTTTQNSVTVPTATQCTRAGYRLLGFATSNTATSASVSPGGSYTPSATTTLYAVWQAYKVTMTFNVNGGSITTGTGTTRYRASNSIVQRSQDSGSTWSNLTATLATDSSTGYVDLWNVSTYGATKTGHSITNATAYRAGSTTGTIINQQTTSTTDTNAATIQNLTGSATLTSDVSVVLYINWTPDTYTVSYNANGHPGTAPSSQTKTYGTNLTLRAFIADSGGTAATVTITGNANGNTWSGSNGSAGYTTTKYAQNYWNTASDGSGTNYTSQGTYSTNAAATMYARFTTTAAAGTSYTLPTGTPSKDSSSTDSFTVGYNANGGTSTPSTQTSTITTSYTFKGWFTQSTGGTQRTTSSRVTAAETVYAQMNSTDTQNAVTLANAISKNSTTEDGYTISYNANGGTSTPTSQTATRTIGYTFDKWALNSATSTTKYNAGDSYTPSANATMYATWTSGTTSEGSVTLAAAIVKNNTTEAGYTITFNANGGSTSKGSETATRTISYTFNKWAKDSATSTTTYNAGVSYSPTANATMYATWTSNTASEGTVTLPTITQCTRTGYKLLGFSTSDTSTTASYLPGDTYIPSSNIVLYAVWQAQGLVSIANGSGFDLYEIYIANGTSFDKYMAYIANGSSFDLYT